MVPITFNADEVFEMAEEIERSGAGFYRRAATKASNHQTKQMLLGMADMEDEHLRTFQAMRSELTEKEKAAMIFDPDNESALYLQTMAEGHGWEGRKTPTELLTGKETIAEILRIAMDAEKNSVVFYVSLKDLVPAKAGKDRIETIIKEEISHVATLNRALAACE